LMTRERYNQLLAEGVDEDTAEQEYYCSFEATVKGAYFSKIMKALMQKGRYYPFAIETMIPCYTYWDLGVADMMTITIVQWISGAPRVVQYYENNNEDISHFIEWLNKWAVMHGVTFAEHWAPHDIEVRTHTGKGTLKTRKQIAKEAGISFKTRERVATKDEGHTLIRQLLPKLAFRKTYGEPETPYIDPNSPIFSRSDPSGCQHLWNALTSYHQKYDPKRKIYLDRPDHDWSSHAVDSIQNMAAWYKEKTDVKPQPGSQKGRRIKRSLL